MALRPEVAMDQVRSVAWDDHLRWLGQHWEPGQHVSAVVPTGGGKSFLLVSSRGLLTLWHGWRVLFIDDKQGRDLTTSSFGIPIDRWPPSSMTTMNRRRREPEHYRLVLPGYRFQAGRSDAEIVERARNVTGEALASAADAGEVVIVVDETRTLTDREPPGLNLRALMRHYWRHARSNGVTLICLTQSPVEVPGEFYDQPSHLYLGPNQDRRRQERLREIGGHSQLIIETVAQLKRHEFLFVGNTKAPPMELQRVKVGR